MTEAIRRVLWFLPVLVAGALLLFLALGNTPTVAGRLERPLFYNASPTSAQLAARQALAHLSAGDPRAKQELLELGGAALPTILDDFATMNVSERRLVAVALWPIAERMGLSEQRTWTRDSPAHRENAPSGDEQLLFWERYREEHALDLRPLSVARLVRRMSDRDDQLRSPDLMAVDTYALPTMVAMLGRIRKDADIDRVRRLLTMISHVTGKTWRLSPQATLSEAQTQATAVRRYWDEHGARFTPLNQFELLVARFSQTEFSTWVFRSSREIARIDISPLRERFLRGGRRSLPPFAFSLIGLLIVGPLVAATIQVVQLNASRFQLERLGLRIGLTAGMMTLIPLLIAQRSETTTPSWLTPLLVGAAYSTFILHRELNDKLDWRTHHVLRGRRALRRITAVAHWLAPSLPTLTPIAVAEAALWVTCLEMSTGLHGLGWETLKALREGDLYWLMAICLTLGMTTGIAQAVADLFLGDGTVRRKES